MKGSQIHAGNKIEDNNSKKIHTSIMDDEYFLPSSCLKNYFVLTQLFLNIAQISRKLMTDRMTVLVELVKNSYDANTNHVYIDFIGYKLKARQNTCIGMGIL